MHRPIWLKLRRLSREDIQAWGDDVVNWIADVIYDRRKSNGIKILQFFLLILSYIFESIVRIRVFLYQTRILRDEPLGCLVVVVGNLTVGGTGKTPVVEQFAKSLTERGRKVAILSRGYKSRSENIFYRLWAWLTHKEKSLPRLVSDGETIFLNSEDAGDEPYMLAKNLPGVAVLVDKDRVKAGHYAIQKLGVDTLILDDGYQYLPLRGRLNLLLIDKTNPFGNGRLLPRGILREPVSHIKRSSYIFLTKSTGEQNTELINLIQNYHPNIDIIECSHKPQHLTQLHTHQIQPLSFIENQSIAALSAIASPEGFEYFLTTLHSKIVYSQRFLDHHRFTKHELEDFYQDALEQNAQIIITTEKDAVRFPNNFIPPLPTYYLRMEIDILAGNNAFTKAVNEICFPKLALKKQFF